MHNKVQKSTAGVGVSLFSMRQNKSTLTVRADVGECPTQIKSRHGAHIAPTSTLGRNTLFTLGCLPRLELSHRSESKMMGEHHIWYEIGAAESAPKPMDSTRPRPRKAHVLPR